MTVVSGSTNGRIYDPHIARFVQADPFVQAPSDLQMLNRYSYVRNNPLNATDPSGFIIPLIAGIAAYAITTDLVITAIVVGLATFTQALVQGADFGQAFIAGISAAALTFAGGHFFPGVEATLGQFALYGAKMGVIGGITSVLQGGKFGHGFISAGLGAAVGGPIGGKIGGAIGSKVAGRVIASAVVGGTVSELTGGKFANGAATGAFASLANEGAISYANAHKAPQLNLPEFSVTPGSPKMGADLTTGEVELVALDLSAPYEGETFNKVAPVSTLAAGELNIDWSAVGPTNVFDVPYLNVDTGYGPSKQDALWGAANIAHQQLENAIAAVITLPIVIGGAAAAGGTALGGSLIGMTLHSAPRLYSGEGITATGLAISGTVGALNSLAGARATSFASTGLVGAPTYQRLIVSGSIRAGGIGQSISVNQAAGAAFGY